MWSFLNVPVLIVLTAMAVGFADMSLVHTVDSKKWILLQESRNADALVCPDNSGNGTECPSDDDVFVYYECCGDSPDRCCPSNRTWVKIVLLSIPVFFLVVALSALHRRCTEEPQDDDTWSKKFLISRMPSVVSAPGDVV